MISYDELTSETERQLKEYKVWAERNPNKKRKESIRSQAGGMYMLWIALTAMYKDTDEDDNRLMSILKEFPDSQEE